MAVFCAPAKEIELMVLDVYPQLDSYPDEVAKSFIKYSACKDKMIDAQLSKVRSALTNSDASKTPE